MKKFLVYRSCESVDREIGKHEVGIEYETDIYDALEWIAKATKDNTLELLQNSAHVR